MEALDQCAKIAQSLQRNIRPLFALDLLCFYSSLNVFNLSASRKNLNPPSLNQNLFYQLEKQERNDKLLKSALTISEKW